MSKPSKNIVHELVEDSWGRVALESDSGGSLESKLTAVASAMVIAIGKEFGVSLDEAAVARVLNESGFSFETYFESLNLPYSFTTPVKNAGTVTTIEAVGNAVYTHYETISK